MLNFTPICYNQSIYLASVAQLDRAPVAQRTKSIGLRNRGSGVRIPPGAQKNPQVHREPEHSSVRGSHESYLYWFMANPVGGTNGRVAQLVEQVALNH